MNLLQRMRLERKLSASALSSAGFSGRIAMHVPHGHRKREKWIRITVYTNALMGLKSRRICALALPLCRCLTHHLRGRVRVSISSFCLSFGARQILCLTRQRTRARRRRGRRNRARGGRKRCRTGRLWSWPGRRAEANFRQVDHANSDP